MNTPAHKLSTVAWKNEEAVDMKSLCVLRQRRGSRRRLERRWCTASAKEMTEPGRQEYEEKENDRGGKTKK